MLQINILKIENTVYSTPGNSNAVLVDVYDDVNVTRDTSTYSSGPI